MAEVHASPVVVAVTPHQPSYFAGERFVCTVTFTNTNVVVPATGRRVVSDSAARDAADATDAADAGSDLSLKRLGLISANERASLGGLGRPIRTHARFSSRSEQWGPGLLLTPPPQKRAPLVVAPVHPHSRQKSIARQPSEDLTQAFGLARQVPQVKAAPSPNPDGFTATGQTNTMDNTLRDSFNTWSQSQRHAAGSSPWSSGSKPTESPLFPQHDTLPPGHEKLLWSFAQLGGTLEIDRTLVDPSDFDRVKLRLAMGEIQSSPAVGTPRTLGGGDFGYDSEVEGGTIEMEHGTPVADTEPRTFSEMASLLLWHPLAQVYNTNPSNGVFMRTNHIPRNQRTGSTLTDIRERALHSRTLPTFSTPPSILDVDVTLAPGESRSYTFAIDLPADLPPTFHGRSVRFDYYMSIGTNRLDESGQQSSRLLHVPIRVYNHIAPRAGAVSVFDLFNPIVLPHVVADVSRGSPDSPHKPADASLHSLVQDLALGKVMAPRGEETERVSCMTAINDMTRAAGKLSYDIAKDGNLAAVLTLVRSKYRLGDTVQAIVRINQPGARLRVVRLAAALETYEDIESDVALQPSGRTQRLTRQVHATHDESVLDTRQTTVELTIPSGTTPEFRTSGVSHRWTLRVSLLTESTEEKHEGENGVSVSLVAPVSHLVQVPDEYADYQTSFKGVPSLCGRLDDKRAVRLEIVECSVPVTVYPNSSKIRPAPVELYA
ncbi:Golgi membrane exchange factor (Ric1p-Rgp1p) subunit [Malassezia cuniculi]|uniref:Golgi membrane exchange factor (Ric1p-Rgp1p) subunit n=1 Tax=Malassezia cuniculi TaxID=948313 RepID=A0AAF0ES45_9BASI|nr:Golgi membrane exchange factor (Ric1p-Rgp1p) subunit [Malassezia cuniculi]